MDDVRRPTPDGPGRPRRPSLSGTGYVIEITTTFTHSLLQVLDGTVALFYDNVKLVVDDSTDTGDGRRRSPRRWLPTNVDRGPRRR